MRPPKSLVLAAGLGTRLRPLTDGMPKCLIPIAGRPVLDYWMIALADAGVRQAMLNTHHLPEHVRGYISQVNARGGQQIIETYEPKLLGSAGTITANRTLADDADELILIYADNFSNADLAAMLAYHRRHDDPMTMLLFRAANPRACGIAEMDADGRIVDFVEKPEQPRGDLANAGVYVVSADAYREMADARAFDLGHDVLPRFIGRMRGWVHDGYHVDVGTHEAYEQVQADAPGVLAAKQFGADGSRPAVFFDRDGTLIEHVHYISDPDDVRLTPGAAEAVIALRRAGYACVVVSNQSAIGRGMMTEAQLAAVNQRMCELFARRGVVFDALHHCPIAPASEDRTMIEHPDRKPGPGMLLRAADDLKLDVARSWMIGDAISDVLAGVNAGCRGSIFIETGMGMTDAERQAGIEYHTAPDLASAVDVILNPSVAGERQA